jgi:ectoine hydroxylase-related dioxygenase (phytanoyl-CoA dioxygenase family)
MILPFSPQNNDGNIWADNDCDFQALSKTTKENGATVIIPRSHLWGPDRCPLDEETISAELEVGDAAMFVGNVYHAGGANVTKYYLL